MLERQDYVDCNVLCKESMGLDGSNNLNQMRNQRSVGDIRFYGKEGSVTANKSDKLVKDQIRQKISTLKKSREGDTLLPNLKDRVEAGYLIDKIEDGKPINV